MKQTRSIQKAAGYTTCRYPFSGLMNPRNPSKYTTNSQLQNNYLNLLLRYPEDYLNQNIVHSLNNLHHPLIPIKEMYERCLDIDNYNQFSNIVSATGGQISLEQASINMLHTLGGNSPPSKEFQIELVAGSHGDLGAKEMAAFDPLFFLHMANVDRIFWLWQTKYQVNTVLQAVHYNTRRRNQAKEWSRAFPNATGRSRIGYEYSTKPLYIWSRQSTKQSPMDIIDIVNQLNYRYTNGSITLEQTA
uniref:Tyrosinase copper-binding domain-containing protein n=1 Tax=Clytia hemisphaerica TaxID=252671 RepID=A0A7M5UEV7_9CNID